ncbi:MAG: Asp-tRNA(Asn)/Glu-tRNA(Gln) amidotransferase subunit GatB [Puniceicoccales bacterium]|jgi:aspartyl-tRNA(Asn)/glutamyl-tRNA(Gln) amidotransferase subunit B|nr:Asp-tRNA(Asn)/Glu-tRNA(Gln) amidotransferase subunit GatB [Puniceicoccales bacterium]
MSSGYETVIGLEIHVQLKTRSKVFAPVPYLFGGELDPKAITPNTLIDPVVLALPGALPVLNRRALEQSVRFGLLVGAQIPALTNWDRKNYFYPDSPKNYQITQKDHPVTLGGEVEIELPGPARNIMGEHKIIRLNHAHLEEDVGKLTHTGTGSLVDYNRAGAALLEIVTEPDLRSPEEAVALLNALRMLLVTAGIADCDMEKGQMRCDANVSVRTHGETVLNTRTEMKNLNTISGVKNAIAYEARRQIREVEAGRTIRQETRGWNADTGRTYPLRSKEDAHDYRYFPDPDLMPVKVSPEEQSRLAATLPERPYDRQRRYMEQYKLPFTVTSVFVPDRSLCEYFEAAAHAHPANPSAVANLIANDLLGALAAAARKDGAATPDITFTGEPDAAATQPLSLADCPVKPAQLAGLVKLTDEDVISRQQAKEVFAAMFATGRDAAAIVDEKGLRQSSDTGAIEKIILDVLALPSSAKPISEFKAGNEKALNSLKGPIMKASQGKANPKLVDEILRRLIV